MHEAGHAVAALVLGCRLHKVTVADGCFHAEVDPPGNLLGFADTREEADALMTLYWAGAAAEMRARCPYPPGWNGDVSDAIMLIGWSAAGVFTAAEERLVAKLRPYQGQIKNPAKMALYDRYGGGARAIVREHWGAVVAVADQLHQAGSLTGEEVHEIAMTAAWRP